MNRSVDCRSDLYSLGVTFYQMLTGALPFTGSDPLEWIHCHIASRRRIAVQKESSRGYGEMQGDTASFTICRSGSSSFRNEVSHTSVFVTVALR